MVDAQTVFNQLAEEKKKQNNKLPSLLEFIELGYTEKDWSKCRRDYGLTPEEIELRDKKERTRRNIMQELRERELRNREYKRYEF